MAEAPRPEAEESASERARAAARARPSAIPIHERLLGVGLAQARAELDAAGVDRRAAGRRAKELAEAEAARAMAHPMEREPEPCFGALWELLSDEEAERAAGAPLGRLRAAAASGPRLSALGLAEGAAVLVDPQLEPFDGAAVLIWAGDGQRAIVRLRMADRAGRLDGRPEGPDDVADLSLSSVFGVVVGTLPRRPDSD